MKPRDRRGSHFLSYLRARLTLDDGFAENPVYKIVGNTTEKKKGIMMLTLIENSFNISEKDRKEAIKKTLEDLDHREKVAFTPTIIPGEIKKRQKKELITWTRDEKGNIVSPFRSRKKTP